MRRLDPNSHRAAVWMALFVTVLWSSSWVLIRWGLDEEGLTPLTFAALRYGMAAILLVGWVIFRERRRLPVARPSRRFLARLALLGMLTYALTQGAVFMALAEQPAATTSLLLSLTPLLVAAGAAVTLAEAPTRAQLSGVVLVAGGAWLYFAGDLGATAAGMVAAVVALGANVASSLLGRAINRSGQLPAVTVTAVSMGVGAGILIFLGIGAEGPPQATTQGWLIIIWLAVVNTAFAFSLWNHSLRRLSALESASLNNTMLIQIVLLAWLFLGEAPGLVGLAGIALLSVGVYLAQRGRRTVWAGPEKTLEPEPGGLPD